MRSRAGFVVAMCACVIHQCGFANDPSDQRCSELGSQSKPDDPDGYF